METPSSARRVTRSQTQSALKNSATISTKECQSKSRPRNGALFDITNDSPIVGLAMQSPSSGVFGKRNMSRIKSTPGSGEALLRGQVKTLLQKVEEEADFTKIPVQSRPFSHLVTSPMGLLAPTPANTPQVHNFSYEVQIVITSPVVAGQSRPPSQVEEGYIFLDKEESLELEDSPSVTRSLLLDFSSDCSSVVTQNTDDDSSSVWSMQVNASNIKDEDDVDEEDVFSYVDDEEDDEEYYEEEGGFVDGLCEGMKKMSFEGKHTRFMYDSEEEEILEAKEVLHLKGLPTPRGKHVRFDLDK